MPEISNEIPSRQELRQYLEESFGKWSLLNPAAGAASAEAIAFLIECWPGALEFDNFVRDTLFLGLLRLNLLPRGDAFWKDTNRRPTFFKLRRHCTEILQHRPEDALSWKVLTLVSEGVHARGWVALFLLGEINLERALLWAMLLAIERSAYDSRICRTDIATFAQQVGQTSEVLALLAKIEENGGAFLADWSRAMAAAIRAE